MKICNICKQEKELSEFNKDKSRPDERQYHCRECQTILAKKYREKVGPIPAKLRMRKYRKENPEKSYKQGRKQRQNNPEQSRLASKKWKEQNQDKCNARESKRRASLLNATPLWLTKGHYLEIEGYYQLAKLMTDISGIPHEVDHTYPLKNPKCNGLHVPWNLQVIFAQENHKKSNKLPQNLGIYL